MLTSLHNKSTDNHPRMHCTYCHKTGMIWYSTFTVYNQLPHLDANQDAPVSDHFDEGHAIIRVLVERLVEEDYPSNAGVDAIIRTEKDLPVLSAILLCVLHSNLGQPLSHAACRATHKMHSVGWSLSATVKNACFLHASHVSTETKKEGKKECALQTHRLIRSQDALPFRNYT